MIARHVRSHRISADPLERGAARIDLRPDAQAFNFEPPLYTPRGEIRFVRGDKASEVRQSGAVVLGA